MNISAMKYKGIAFLVSIFFSKAAFSATTDYALQDILSVLILFGCAICLIVGFLVGLKLSSLL